MKKSYKIAAYVGIMLMFILMTGRVRKLSRDLKSEQNRTHALLTDMETLQDENGVEVYALEMKLSEFRRYNKEQADSLEKMGVRLKDLQAVARHQMEINAELKGMVTDTVVIREIDSVDVLVPLKKLTIDDRPHLYIGGIFEDGNFDGKIEIPVEVNQTIEAVWGRKFLWWRWKLRGFKQKITTNNPYVKIKHSEFVRIKK